MRPIKTILQHHHDPSPPVGGPWFPVGEPTPPRMPCLPPPTGRASGNFHADPCRAGCVLSVRLKGPPCPIDAVRRCLLAGQPVRRSLPPSERSPLSESSLRFPTNEGSAAHRDRFGSPAARSARDMIDLIFGTG